MLTRSPKFRIEYRDSNGLMEMIAELSDIESSLLNIFDLLSCDHEVWIYDVSGDGISDAMAEYIVRTVLQVIEDMGQPIIFRKYRKSIMIRLDVDAAPYGLKAYKFFKRYYRKDGLLQIFGATRVNKYDKIIRKSKIRK